MNISQRNNQFLAFTKSLQPTQDHVQAVAEAIGCSEWVGHCNRSPKECYCANGARKVLEVNATQASVETTA